jgi:hypothetical protein
MVKHYLQQRFIDLNSMVIFYVAQLSKTVKTEAHPRARRADRGERFLTDRWHEGLGHSFEYGGTLLCVVLDCPVLSRIL